MPGTMNPARFDLVTLALFVNIAREGSISGGARLSHLAVGAASRRISDLEAALGTPLLYRQASGVELTEAGQACLTHAQRVLHEVGLLAGSLSDYAHGLRGQVRVAANTSSLTQFLPEDLATFMDEQPGVRIELEEQNSTEVVNALRENRADLGIFADRTPCAGLETVPYRLDELVLVAPPDHALADHDTIDFVETLDHDHVGLPTPTSLALRLQEESARLERQLRLRIQVRSFDAVCRMVAATRTIGVLPRRAATPHAQSMKLRLIGLKDAWAQRWLLLGVRDRDALTAPARQLLEHLAARSNAD